MAGKVGRPEKDAALRKDIQISVRIGMKLRDRLKESAKANGHSFASEVTNRLEASFERPYEKRIFGGSTTWAFALLLALTLKELRIRTGHPWHEEKFAFDQAQDALNYLLLLFKPRRGRAEVPPSDLPPAKIGQIRRVTPGVPHRETAFGSEVAEQLFAAIEAHYGEYGRMKRQISASLSGGPTRAEQFDDKIYSSLGAELVPLTNRGTRRVRKKETLRAR